MEKKNKKQQQRDPRSLAREAAERNNYTEEMTREYNVNTEIDRDIDRY